MSAPDNFGLVHCIICQQKCSSSIYNVWRDMLVAALLLNSAATDPSHADNSQIWRLRTKRTTLANALMTCDFTWNRAARRIMTGASSACRDRAEKIPSQLSALIMSSDILRLRSFPHLVCYCTEVFCWIQRRLTPLFAGHCPACFLIDQMRSVNQKLEMQKR